MGETKTFEFCVQMMMAEFRSAKGTAQARAARGFFQNMMGLHLSLEESTTAWQESLQRWENAKARSDPNTSLADILIRYLLGSGHLADPMVTEFREFQRLRFSSTVDYLTGTNNRRFFDTTLAKEVPRAARYSGDLSLILIDLNRFKEVNDTHGHEFGDRLLVLTAKVLKEALRVSDSAYRIGGDEFALLLPETSQAGAVILADRLRIRYEEATQAMADLQVPVSLAFGVATCPREATDAKALFTLADQRLYDLKRSMGSPRCAPRRFKRIPTEDLDAYVVLRSAGITRKGKMVDFSFGGVGLYLPGENSIPDDLWGDLHLPVLPTASVALHKVYAKAEEGSGLRLGLCFLEPPLSTPDRTV